LRALFALRSYDHPFLRNIALFSVLLKKLSRWLIQMHYSEHFSLNPIFERKIIAIAEEQKLS